MDRRSLWTAACALLLVACGSSADDDADDTGKTVAGSSASAAGGSRAASSGAAGSTSNPGSTIGSGTAGAIATAPMSVECGTATCEAPAAAFGLVEPCCGDAATGTCGTAILGGACMVPAKSDSRCPGIDLMGLFTLPSCCSPQGQCGIDGAMFGAGGCVSLADASAMAMGFGGGFGGFITLPAPQACDGTADAGVPEDAGS